MQFAKKETRFLGSPELPSRATCICCFTKHTGSKHINPAKVGSMLARRLWRWYIEWVSEYCFTSLSAYWDNIATEGSQKPGLCPTFEWLLYSVQYHRQQCRPSLMHLNSFEHWICTTTVTNIWPDRDSNLVPPRYRPQLIQMSHRGGLWNTEVSSGVNLGGMFSHCRVNVGPASQTLAQR